MIILQSCKLLSLSIINCSVLVSEKPMKSWICNWNWTFGIIFMSHWYLKQHTHWRSFYVILVQGCFQSECLLTLSLQIKPTAGSLTAENIWVRSCLGFSLICAQETTPHGKIIFLGLCSFLFLSPPFSLSFFLSYQDEAEEPRSD